MAATQSIKVVIGGGKGFVGRRLCQVLTANEAFEVCCISRESKNPKDIDWNLVKSIGLPECRAVVNLAGENLMNPLRRWNQSFTDDLRESRIGTTKLLAEAIKASANPPSVYVGASAIGFYRPGNVQPHSESTSGGDFDFMSRLCADWEAAASGLDGLCRRVTIRIGLVLGRDGGLVRSLYPAYYCGLGGPTGTGTQHFPWIHVDDVCGIIKFAIENENVNGTLNGTSPSADTNNDFNAAFGRAMSRTGHIRMPKSLLSLVYGQERAKVMTEGPLVYPKRTIESGYKFKFASLEAACRDVVSAK